MNNAVEEPEVGLDLALELGLTAEEYGRILEILGRVPSYTELGIFSVMWSEHCSYKNSILELKKLPRTGKRLLVKAGEENAGLVDIGGGYAVAFKIESHNHPSAVEPYQGAATGVGGILRDIFTMGARPVAALNSLRFGSLDHPRTRYLLKGVVKGIGDYGNSFGVPTVAGEVYFDECYNENPIVNAMAVGIVRHDEIAKAAAKGVGNIVMIVGSSTGRDGIHGATFASELITDESEQRRPSVQVGDPFTEKLLLEATLEAIRQGAVVGIQDMGAAGITCSTSEMSARGGTGMHIDLDEVPVREEEMSGYEIMLSESQERMLVVAAPDREEALKAIYGKWDLPARKIGTVSDDGRLKVRHRGVLIADIPADTLVLGGGAPVYERAGRMPEYIEKLRSFDFDSLPVPSDFNRCLLELLASPNLCSRKWVYTQYDMSIRTNTFTDIMGDAAVIGIKGLGKALAMKTDCNSRYVYLNPYVGSQIAVAESARNVVCVGGTPLAITNCLNFGDPYKPEIYWQFREAVRGIGDACRALNTPVTGGNVSFYNENPGQAVYPTPVIGMVGEIEDTSKIISAAFRNAGDMIVLLGSGRGHIGGSEYLKVHHNLVRGDAPPIDLVEEQALQAACLEMIHAGLLSSAHDISDGGFAVAVAEGLIYACEQRRPLGASVAVPAGSREDFMLFGEDQSRILISAPRENLPEIRAIAARHDLDHALIGEVVPNVLEIGAVINLKTEDVWECHSEALRKRVELNGDGVR